MPGKGRKVIEVTNLHCQLTDNKIEQKELN